MTRPAAIAVALFITSCSVTPRTQVMVTIDAEPGVRLASSSLRLVLLGGEGATTGPTADRLDRILHPGAGDPQYPFTLAVAPLDGDVGRVYAITATAFDDADGFIGEVRAVSGFVEGRTLHLRLVLEDSCRGRVCLDDQTCVAGACRAAEVRPEDLPEFGMDAGPGSDGGERLDGGLPDDAGDPADGGAPIDGSSPTDGASGGPPPNDLCANAIALTGTSGTRRGDSFAAATRQTVGCAPGPEIFYSVTLAQRSIFYVDTFGSSFDTAISIRSGCEETALPIVCEDDDCDVEQDQLATVLNPGTHYIVVHDAIGSAAGTVDLRWQILRTTTEGATTRVTGGVQRGTLLSRGSIMASCRAKSAGEDAFFFTMCPGIMRTITASTCPPGSTGGTFLWQTTVSLRGVDDMELACNVRDCSELGSRVSSVVSGPGVYVVFVDSEPSSSGVGYGLSVTGF